MILPFDVFYISVLSEKYKGSRLAIHQRNDKGNLVFISDSFQQEQEQFGYLYSEKIPGSVTVKPAIFPGIIPKLNAKVISCVP